MPPLVSFTGGKGGTGKSFIATNIAYLLGLERRHLLADLDVEAPNDHILLGVKELGEKEPVPIFFPRIDYSKCTLCGACAKVCDTGAIIMSKNRPPIVMPRLCSGCKACLYACVYDAIKPGARIIGFMHTTPVTIGESAFTLITGVLHQGEEHTAPLVHGVKSRALRRAREDSVPLLVDTGAGTGNSISIAIQYSDLVVAVTEPTPLGLHDLRAILEITRGLGMRTWVVLNRAGIGDSDPHRRLAREYGVEHYHEVPYAKEAVEAYVKGVPVVAYAPNSRVAEKIRELYDLMRPIIAG